MKTIRNLNIPELRPSIPKKNGVAVKIIDGSSDKQLLALLYNIVSAFLAFILLSSLMSLLGFSNGFMTITLPIMVIVVLVIFNYDRLGRTTNPLTGDVYSDIIFSGKMIVYFKGFHFVKWSSNYIRTIDFFKHEEMKAQSEGGSAFTTSTKEGYQLSSDLITLFRPRQTEAALSKYLSFDPKDLARLVSVTVKQRFSDIIAVNFWENILEERGEIINEMAVSFEGEGKESDFELETGLDIRNPALTAFELTASSRDLYETKARTKLQKETIEDTMKVLPDLKHDDAAFNARVLMGISKEQAVTIRGIPKTAQYVGIGTEGLFPGSKGGK